MKISSVAKYPLAIGLMALITSCDDPKKPQGKVQQQLTTEELAREAEFGPWMSQAGLKFAQEQLPSGDYFAEIEGRVNQGENQYRAIQRTLDKEKFVNAEAMWGLEADSLYRQEIDRLRVGMERSASQVFTDTTGTAIHQVVMVLPVGAGPKLASAESVVIPAAPEPSRDGSIPPTPPPGLTASEIEEVVGEALPDAVDDSSDAIVVTPEVTPLGDVNREPENTAEATAEPEMTDAPAPSPTTTEEGGTEPTEVGALLGELETPEPEVTPVPESGDDPVEPARGVVVEDDEGTPETGGDESEPDTASEAEATPPATEEPEPAPQPKFINYTVVRGDTLSGLSRRFKVSISAIKKASGFRSDMLRIGQKLKIPTK